MPCSSVRGSSDIDFPRDQSLPLPHTAFPLGCSSGLAVCMKLQPQGSFPEHFTMVQWAGMGCDFSYSQILASVTKGPCLFLLTSPYRTNLYFRPGSRDVMGAERWGPSTGITWGPSLSLYWITKESNSPSGTVQCKSRESEVTSVTVSSPRRGAPKDFLGVSPSLSGVGVGAKAEHGQLKPFPYPPSPSLSSACFTPS